MSFLSIVDISLWYLNIGHFEKEKKGRLSQSGEQHFDQVKLLNQKLWADKLQTITFCLDTLSMKVVS